MVDAAEKLLLGTAARQGQALDVAPEEFKGTREQTADVLSGILQDQPKATGPFAAAVMDPESGLVTRAVSQATAPVAGRQALARTVREGGPVNPFLAQDISAAQRGTLQQFEQDRESLRGAFARAGQRGGRIGSSVLRRREAELGRGAAQTLAGQAATAASQEQNRVRNQQQAAIATSIGVQQEDLNRTTAALEAAGLPRQVLDSAIARAADQNAEELNQLLNAVRIGGDAGRATILRIAAIAPGDGALSDIAGIVGGIFFGPGGAAVGSAIGQSVETAARS